MIGDMGSVSSRLVGVEGHELCDLSMGWQAARSASEKQVDASGLDTLNWIAARALAKSPADVSAKDVQKESRPKNHANPGR